MPQPVCPLIRTHIVGVFKLSYRNCPDRMRIRAAPLYKMADVNWNEPYGFLLVFMRPWDGAESAPSIYKNLLRVIEVISVWFSFGLFCCCLFFIEYLSLMNGESCGSSCSGFSSILLLKVKRSAERHPVCPLILLQMCQNSRENQLRFSIRPPCCRGIFFHIFQGCKVKEGMRNLATVFMVFEILISPVSC